MRPAQKAPENEDRLAKIETGGQTSMRPAQKAPENESVFPHDQPLSFDFNEAGAKSAGKPRKALCR